MTKKWHYTITMDDSRPELKAGIDVMFDGKLRCTLRLTNLWHSEAEAIRAARFKVLEWVGKYLPGEGAR